MAKPQSFSEAERAELDGLCSDWEWALQERERLRELVRLASEPCASLADVNAQFATVSREVAAQLGQSLSETSMADLIDAAPNVMQGIRDTLLAASMREALPNYEADLLDFESWLFRERNAPGRLREKGKARWKQDRDRRIATAVDAVYEVLKGTVHGHDAATEFLAYLALAGLSALHADADSLNDLLSNVSFKFKQVLGSDALREVLKSKTGDGGAKRAAEFVVTQFTDVSTHTVRKISLACRSS